MCTTIPSSFWFFLLLLLLTFNVCVSLCMWGAENNFQTCRLDPQAVIITTLLFSTRPPPPPPAAIWSEFGQWPNGRHTSTASCRSNERGGASLWLSPCAPLLILLATCRSQVFPSTSGSQELNSDHQPWQQSPLSTKPSCWLLLLVLCIQSWSY